MASISDRIKSAWNAFNGVDPVRQYVDVGPGSSYRPDHTNLMFYNGDRSIIKAISNRIAVSDGPRLFLICLKIRISGS